MTALLERFASNFFIEPNSGCWLWTGSINKAGYGLMRYDSGILAHRYSWQTHNSQIPKGLCVLHKCDTPSCVNPNHLFIGTQLENLADMRRKGRASGPKIGRHGEKSPTAKLTASQVAEIRKSSGSQRALAAKYGVCQQNICDILRGRRWSHTYVGS